ncbi:MAG: hypothetical protein D6820_04370, partial [Lentisphaerae bacterium]
MTIKFHCYYCDSRLEAEDEHAGLEVECPSCNQKITVPLISVNTEEIPRLRDIFVEEDKELDALLEIPGAEAESIEGEEPNLSKTKPFQHLLETRYNRQQEGSEKEEKAGDEVALGPTRFRAGQR